MRGLKIRNGKICIDTCEDCFFLKQDTDHVYFCQANPDITFEGISDFLPPGCPLINGVKSFKLHMK